jgi:ABC-type transport system involved in cytochrome c biogenesis permease component
VIEAPSGVNDSLLFLFYVSFLLGRFCYGLSLAIAKGLDRQVGWLFLLWTALNIPVLIDSVTSIELMSNWFNWVGPYFLPFARTAIGSWLWKKATLTGFEPVLPP